MPPTMTLLAKVVLILMILTATKAGKKRTCQKKTELFASKCSKKKGIIILRILFSRDGRSSFNLD